MANAFAVGGKNLPFNLGVEQLRADKRAIFNVSELIEPVFEFKSPVQAGFGVAVLQSASGIKMSAQYVPL